MSIQIPTLTPALAVSNFFAANELQWDMSNVPGVTIFAWMYHPNRIAGSNMYGVALEDPSTGAYLRAGPYYNSAGSYRALRATGKGDGGNSSDAVVPTSAISGLNEGVWFPFAGVFGPISGGYFSSLEMFAYDEGTGTQLAQALNGSALISATPADIRDLDLFGNENAFDDSPRLYAHAAVWKRKLTIAEFDSLRSGQNPSTLHPDDLLLHFAADEDWGAGDIVDLSANGRNITPRAEWSYSADNPPVDAAASGPVGPVITNDTVTLETDEGFTLSFDTDVTNGTAYYVVYPTTATLPTAEQVAAGTDGDGVAALASGSMAINPTVQQAFPAITGLSAGVTYGYSIVQSGIAA